MGKSLPNVAQRRASIGGYKNLGQIWTEMRYIEVGGKVAVVNNQQSTTITFFRLEYILLVSLRHDLAQ